MKPTHLIVHHTASNRDTTTLDAVNAWHKARGFPKGSRGYYVGYHFLFLKDGFVQTRDEDEVGAHTLGGWNYKALGLCFAGNFEIDQALTKAQSDDFKKIARLLMQTHNIPIENVLLHRDCWQTACPGKYIDKNFIRNLINQEDNKPMELKENHLYQVTTGGPYEHPFGIVVGGQLLVDRTENVLATFLVRNNGNTDGKTVACNAEDWLSVAHYNLKKEEVYHP